MPCLYQIRLSHIVFYAIQHTPHQRFEAFGDRPHFTFVKGLHKVQNLLGGVFALLPLFLHELTQAFGQNIKVFLSDLQIFVEVTATGYSTYVGLFSPAFLDAFDAGELSFPLGGGQGLSLKNSVRAHTV